MWLIEDIFQEPDDVEKALYGDVDWWESTLLGSRRGPLEFPLRVLRRRGPQALVDRPRLTIGTIHSVKGGEADVVYLFPDTSGAGHREWLSSGVRRDAVVRQFYVGMTRARSKLVVCSPSSNTYVGMRRYLPKELVG